MDGPHLEATKFHSFASSQRTCSDTRLTERPSELSGPTTCTKASAVELQVGMDLRKAALLRSLLIKTEEKSNPTPPCCFNVDGMAVDGMSNHDLPNLQVK